MPNCFTKFQHQNFLFLMLKALVSDIKDKPVLLSQRCCSLLTLLDGCVDSSVELNNSNTRFLKKINSSLNSVKLELILEFYSFGINSLKVWSCLFCKTFFCSGKTLVGNSKYIKSYQVRF